MKRLACILIAIMFPLVCSGDGWFYTGAGGGGEEAFCSTCTGSGTSPSLCWEITGTSTTLTESGGCVVSGGDGTATAQSGSSIESSPGGVGGYSIYSPGTYDAHMFDVSSDDLIDDAEGTIQLDVYVHTWAASTEFFHLDGGSTDSITGKIYGTDEMRISYRGNNTEIGTGTTVGADLVVDTWYTITVKWRVGTGVQSLSVLVGETEVGSSSTDLTAFAEAPGGADLKLGNNSGVDGDIYVRNIKIWKTWQE